MFPVPWMRHKPDVHSIMECPCRKMKKKEKKKKMKDRKWKYKNNCTVKVLKNSIQLQELIRLGSVTLLSSAFLHKQPDIIIANLLLWNSSTTKKEAPKRSVLSFHAQLCVFSQIFICKGHKLLIVKDVSGLTMYPDVGCLYFFYIHLSSELQIVVSFQVCLSIVQRKAY